MHAADTGDIDCWATSETLFTSLLTVTYMAPPGSRTKKAQRLKLENTGCLFLLPRYLSLVTFNSNNQASPFIKLLCILLSWSELNVPARFQATWTLCVVQYCELKPLYGEHMLTERERERKKEEQPFSRHSAALQGGLSDACRRLNQPIQTNTSID